MLATSSSVDTLFMHFMIDIFYLDRSSRAVKAVSPLRPFRIRVGPRGAPRSVIEIPSGTIAATRSAVDDEPAFEA